MIKKITAAVLALLFCFMTVGCSNDGAPDGMYMCSLEGEPFKLYVPDAWTSNSSGGISGAFFSATDNIAVTARGVKATDGEMTLDAYVEECIDSYTETVKLFDLKENAASVLGGVDAKRLVYTSKQDNTAYKFCVYIAKYSGEFVTLTFYSPIESYDTYIEQFNMIVDAFVLCERGEAPTDEITDKKTPEGMKIASSDVLEYRLYVPTSWVCSSVTARSEAYYPEKGKPNVTVTSYSPDVAMSPEEYFEECEEQYKESISGYERISVTDTTVAQKDAKSYVYRAVYSNTSVKIMQTVFVYNQMVYSFTYTALEDSFDAHMDDVNAMLDAFTFR